MSPPNNPSWPIRLGNTAPPIACKTAREYLRSFVRPALLRAVNEDVLAVGSHEISRHVRVVSSKLAEGAYDLVGGRRNFKRREELADLRTHDGGWLFFNAVVRPEAGELQIVAYDVERVFGPGHRPRWVRYDYNEPGHPNEARGLRSHLHPGNDDIQLPSAVFAPHELIEILLGPLGPQGQRRRRTSTL